MAYRPEGAKLFGAAIKYLLDKKGLSQRKFAEQAGLETGYVSKLVNGEISEPRQENRSKIAQGLGVTEQQLQELVVQYIEGKRETDGGSPNSGEIASTTITPNTPSTNSNFVGREKAIADLNNLIQQGAKAIVIQAAGGVGKTTLAWEYLKTQGFDLVLDLPMAKVKENISAVEGVIEGSAVEDVIEGWLKYDFQEESGREFREMLRRLKRQLQTRKVGVLIDNLEPALDKQCRFIEPHRCYYVELLRVLADPTVQSVTLITSRDRLCDDDVNVEHYPLSGLDEQAWQQFFSSRNINIHTPTLKAMHNAYGGNAKAMDIFCGAIRQEFDGDMAAYWRENSADLLVKPDLKNLVTNQFNRLQEIDFQAYQLLCRLGCYRYQDVPTVSTQGLLCLLWDVEEARPRRIIESLRNRSLVEFKKGEYWLHPMIREEAIGRLRASDDWENTNRKSAEFWAASIEIIETVKDALTALEAYYHYVEIDDFEFAGSVIVKDRSNKWEKDECLGIASYRLGLLQKMIFAINRIVNKLNSSYNLGRLYNILGDLYWLTGSFTKSIESHQKSEEFAVIFKQKSLEVVASFNIGLCKIDLLEVNQAVELFEKVISLAENTECHRYAIQSWYCLAFLKSCLGLRQEALYFANKSYNELPTVKWSAWAKGYSFLFLGQTYNNLREAEKSIEMYNKAIQFAEESHYTQVRAKALTGIAELCRKQGDLETAIPNHLKSIELLDKIGAKCDLAEAYYQLGLTYQKIGDTEKSQDNFDKAIQLFSEMEAPKQVKKVRRAMENGG